jgi:hypothetical protein
MRFLEIVLALTVSLAPGKSVLAQKYLTDAQRVDLAGPVESASTTQVNSRNHWSQPGGPALVEPLWCVECEFDRDGNQTKSGQGVDGIFRGEMSRITYDENGHARDRVVQDASTGETLRDETLGPFGVTERTNYRAGMPDNRWIFTYDAHGRVRDLVTLNNAGIRVSHLHTDRDSDGEVKEKWGAGADGKLWFRQTYDAETKVEQYIEFNQLGQQIVHWTFVGGKLTSFRSDGDSGTGNFNEHPDNDTVENYACQNGQCAIARIHYHYLDSNCRNPQSIEWRDAKGKLRFAAYYKYEIDAFRNWTHREVWVWSTDLRKRTLYETDSREILYWPDTYDTKPPATEERDRTDSGSDFRCKFKSLTSGGG